MEIFDEKIGQEEPYINWEKFLHPFLSKVDRLQRSREGQNHQFTGRLTCPVHHTDIIVTVLFDSDWYSKQPGLTVLLVLVLTDDVTGQCHVSDQTSAV